MTNTTDIFVDGDELVLRLAGLDGWEDVIEGELMTLSEVLAEMGGGM